MAVEAIFRPYKAHYGPRRYNVSSLEKVSRNKKFRAQQKLSHTMSQAALPQKNFREAKTFANRKKFRTKASEGTSASTDREEG